MKSRSIKTLERLQPGCSDATRRHLISAKALGLLALCCGMLSGPSQAAETNSVVPSPQEPTITNAVPPQSTREAKHKLSGAELYAIHCNRCHPERYPIEMSDAHWKTLITHMRVRANLPAQQAQTIMKYMQEEAGK